MTSVPKWKVRNHLIFILKDAYRFLHLEERESFTMIAIASPSGAVPVHNVCIVQSCAPVSKIALRTFCSPGRIHWSIIMPQYTLQGYHVHQLAGCFKMREHSKFIEANTTWIFLAPTLKRNLDKNGTESSPEDESRKPTNLDPRVDHSNFFQ